jgi:hypothetical protein
MSNEVTVEQIEDFNKMYGDVLPNHDHEPIKFMYYWNMYLQVKSNENSDE